MPDYIREILTYVDRPVRAGDPAVSASGEFSPLPLSLSRRTHICSADTHGMPSTCGENLTEGRYPPPHRARARARSIRN